MRRTGDDTVTEKDKMTKTLSGEKTPAMGLSECQRSHKRKSATRSTEGRDPKTAETNEKKDNGLRLNGVLRSVVGSRG